jgi:hypothetical protein
MSGAHLAEARTERLQEEAVECKVEAIGAWLVSIRGAGLTETIGNRRLTGGQHRLTTWRGNPVLATVGGIVGYMVEPSHDYVFVEQAVPYQAQE